MLTQVVFRVSKLQRLLQLFTGAAAKSLNYSFSSSLSADAIQTLCKTTVLCGFANVQMLPYPSFKLVPILN